MRLCGVLYSAARRLSCSNLLLYATLCAGQVFCPTCPPGALTTTSGSLSCDLCQLVGAGCCFSLQTKNNQYSSHLCLPHDMLAPLQGFNCMNGTTSPCQPGHYADEKGLDECKSCKPGTYTSKTRAIACDKCRAGSYSGSAAPTCTFCPAGTFQNEMGQAGCKKCTPGSASDQVGRTSDCFDCEFRASCARVQFSVCLRLCTDDMLPQLDDCV